MSKAKKTTSRKAKSKITFPLLWHKDVDDNGNDVFFAFATGCGDDLAGGLIYEISQELHNNTRVWVESSAVDLMIDTERMVFWKNKRDAMRDIQAHNNELNWGWMEYVEQQQKKK